MTKLAIVDNVLVGNIKNQHSKYLIIYHVVLFYNQ